MAGSVEGVVVRIAVACVLTIAALPARGSPAPIVGGSPVPDGPTPIAAAVDPDGIVRCTAFVVDPSWALTAAHCVTEAEDAGLPLTELWFGVDLVDGVPDLVVAIADAVIDPAYTGGPDDDLAMLALASPLAVPVARLVDGAPQAYDPLDAYGYGVTADGASDGGVLRTVTLEVLAVDPGVFRTYTPGANLCSGDSGGPLVVPGTDPLAVAGIAAFVDPTCLGGTGGAVRSDVAYAFAKDLVPGLVPAELGQGTSTDTTTETGGTTGTTGTTGSSGGTTRDIDDRDTGGVDEDASDGGAGRVVTRGGGCAHVGHGWVGWVTVAAGIAGAGRRTGIRRSRVAARLPHPAA